MKLTKLSIFYAALVMCIASASYGAAYTPAEQMERNKVQIARNIQSVLKSPATNLNDPYAILGLLNITKQDDKETVTQKYRAASKIFHPDRNIESPEVGEVMRYITNAYQLLIKQLPDTPKTQARKQNTQAREQDTESNLSDADEPGVPFETFETCEHRRAEAEAQQARAEAERKNREAAEAAHAQSSPKSSGNAYDTLIREDRFYHVAYNTTGYTNPIKFKNTTLWPIKLIYKTTDNVVHTAEVAPGGERPLGNGQQLYAIIGVAAKPLTTSETSTFHTYTSKLYNSYEPVYIDGLKKPNEQIIENQPVVINAKTGWFGGWDFTVTYEASKGERLKNLKDAVARKIVGEQYAKSRTRMDPFTRLFAVLTGEQAPTGPETITAALVPHVIFKNNSLWPIELTFFKNNHAYNIALASGSSVNLGTGISNIITIKYLPLTGSFFSGLYNEERAYNLDEIENLPAPTFSRGSRLNASVSNLKSDLQNESAMSYQGSIIEVELKTNLLGQPSFIWKRLRAIPANVQTATDAHLLPDTAPSSASSASSSSSAR